MRQIVEFAKFEKRKAILLQYTVEEEATMCLHRIHPSCDSVHSRDRIGWPAGVDAAVVLAGGIAAPKSPDALADSFEYSTLSSTWNFAGTQPSVAHKGNPSNRL